MLNFFLHPSPIIIVLNVASTSQRGRVMVKMLNVPLLSLIITAISITSASSTLFTLRSFESSQCLTVRDAHFKDGTPVVMLVCLIAREFTMMTTESLGVRVKTATNNNSGRFPRART